MSTVKPVYMRSAFKDRAFEDVLATTPWIQVTDARHSDDSPGMDHEHPIAVVSFGQAREIWWREKGQTGVIPADQRQLLEHGSLFVMPAGMQRTHQHRIPKGDRAMTPRISLTYRHYVPVAP